MESSAGGKASEREERRKRMNLRIESAWWSRKVKRERAAELAEAWRVTKAEYLMKKKGKVHGTVL
jgi:hypothetical protein